MGERVLYNFVLYNFVLYNFCSHFTEFEKACKLGLIVDFKTTKHTQLLWAPLDSLCIPFNKTLRKGAVATAMINSKVCLFITRRAARHGVARRSVGPYLLIFSAQRGAASGGAVP